MPPSICFQFQCLEVVDSMLITIHDYLKKKPFKSIRLIISHVSQFKQSPNLGLDTTHQRAQAEPHEHLTIYISQALQIKNSEIMDYNITY